MSTSASGTVKPPPPALVGWGMLLLNWALPGVGFMMVGRQARGLVQFCTVLLTLALGLALRGGVMWPTWDFQHQEVNLINNITFIIQMGAGLPALASLLGHLNDFQPLGGIPTSAHYELGSYFIVVAGALNYFASCNFHDRLVRITPRFQAQEGSPAKS